jgi:hypothetical protein
MHILLMAFLDQGTFDALWVVSPLWEKKKYEREHTVLIPVSGLDHAIEIIGLLPTKGYERVMISPP